MYYNKYEFKYYNTSCHIHNLKRIDKFCKCIMSDQSNIKSKYFDFSGIYITTI